MEEYKIGPGTAGLAQRIPSRVVESKEEERLYVLKPNKLMPCTRNQY
jgi:hypothetical protein